MPITSIETLSQTEEIGPAYTAAWAQPEGPDTEGQVLWFCFCEEPRASYTEAGNSSICGYRRGIRFLVSDKNVLDSTEALAALRRGGRMK